MSKRTEAITLINEYVRLTNKQEKEMKIFNKIVHEKTNPSELKQIRKATNKSIDFYENKKEKIYKKFYKLMTKEFGEISYSQYKKYPNGIMDKNFVIDLFNKK